MIGVMKQESQQQSKGTINMLNNTAMIQLNMDSLTGSATLKINQRKGTDIHVHVTRGVTHEHNEWKSGWGGKDREMKEKRE